jgi:hypothetical protein
MFSSRGHSTAEKKFESLFYATLQNIALKVDRGGEPELTCLLLLSFAPELIVQFFPPKVFSKLKNKKLESEVVLCRG